MSPSKKIDVYGDFVPGVYLSEVQNPIPPPTFTHTLYTRIQYAYSCSEGGRGRGERKRRLDGRKFAKLVRSTNMTDCISSL